MGEMVTIKVEDGTTSGYYSKAAKESQTGLVVLQEWWGLVPHIKDLSERFAKEGYHALSPDLYHGKSTVEAEEANHLMEGLDWGLAVKEIKACVDHLRAQGCTKVGVVGFCMGGALSCLGSATAGVDAAIAFYGFPPKPNPMDKECPPTLLFFGENEDFFSIPDAQEWAKNQRERGVSDSAVTVYKGAGHAFFNDTRPEAYHEESAKDAWQRSLAHFSKHLS